VCDQLSLILGLQVLSIFSLFTKDVIGDVLGRALDIGELLNHATNFPTVFFKNGVEGTRHVLCALVASEFNILDHGILLDSMKDVRATLATEVIPLEVNLL